jgi:outer membrane protein assembly factor BamB
MMRHGRLLAWCSSLVFLSLPIAATAQLPAGPGDWPGWRGADRTGVSTETGLLKEWPKDGPPLVWKVKGLGEGYSTPSIARGRIYVMGNQGLDDEFVQARNVADGAVVWQTAVGKVGKPKQMPPYTGSRSTPTVDGDRVYALGSDGDLVCLDVAGGKEIWKKNLCADFGGESGTWAFAESVLIDGDTLVCTPGGQKAAIVALNKKNGDVVWQSEVADAGEAGYASAIAADGPGGKQYIQFLRKSLIGVAAKDGKLLWRFGKTATPTDCTTAIVHDGYVFHAALGPGGGGTAVLQLTPEGVKEVNFGKSLMNHHGGVIRVGDYVYGTNQAGLVCVEFKTGKENWQNRSVGKGSITAADGHLYVRGEQTGAVALVEATPDAYKEKGRFTPPDRSDKPAWPHPVVAGGRLYLRDKDTLLCYDIKAK